MRYIEMGGFKYFLVGCNKHSLFSLNTHIFNQAQQLQKNAGLHAGNADQHTRVRNKIGEFQRALAAVHLQ